MKYKPNLVTKMKSSLLRVLVRPFTPNASISDRENSERVSSASCSPRLKSCLPKQGAMLPALTHFTLTPEPCPSLGETTMGGLGSECARVVVVDDNEAFAAAFVATGELAAPEAANSLSPATYEAAANANKADCSDCSYEGGCEGTCVDGSESPIDL